jgi:hypothetical protein
MEALLSSERSDFPEQRIGQTSNAQSTEAYRAAMGFEYRARGISSFIQGISYALVALLISWQITLRALAFSVVSV